MHSGHVQTEAFRPGLKGPYALVFSRSGTPSANSDLSFMGGLGLSGYVATSGRGYGEFHLATLFVYLH
jgi:rhamnogalacturonan endolyase